METIINNNTNDFLNILNQVSFNDELFRKELKKTLNWIPKSEYPKVESWLNKGGFNTKYPDLFELTK